MLRDNIFGGKDNYQQFQAKYNAPPSHLWAQVANEAMNNHNGSAVYSRPSDPRTQENYMYRQQGLEELEMAVQQQNNQNSRVRQG